MSGKSDQSSICLESVIIAQFGSGLQPGLKSLFGWEGNSNGTDFKQIVQNYDPLSKNCLFELGPPFAQAKYVFHSRSLSKWRAQTGGAVAYKCEAEPPSKSRRDCAIYVGNANSRE